VLFRRALTHFFNTHIKELDVVDFAGASDYNFVVRNTRVYSQISDTHMKHENHKLY